MGGSLSLSLASLSLGDTLLEDTPSYMATECLVKNHRPSIESDAWARGITILEFLTYEDAWEKVLKGVGRWQSRSMLTRHRYC